jgi:hypothetical protein
MATVAPRRWVDLRAATEPDLANHLLEEGLVLFRCEPDAEEFLSLISRIRLSLSQPGSLLE